MGTLLFDKSMNELLEAFSAADFDRTACEIYGRSDVEAWLAGQRIAERPDADPRQSGAPESPFVRRPPLLENWVTALREGAAPTGIDSEVFARFNLTTAQRTVMVALMIAPGTAFYAGTMYRGVLRVGHRAYAIRFHDIVQDRSGAVTHNCRLDGQMVLMELANRDASSHVLDVLLAEWRRRGAQWERARAIICDAFEPSTDIVRDVLKRQFDNAIAVCADGKTLVHADWVVVRSSSNRAVIFPAAVFRGAKARCPDSGSSANIDCGVEGRIRPECFSQQALVRKVRECLPLWGSIQDGTASLLSLVDWSGMNYHTPQVYLTTPSLCPDPLPGGGIVVTI